MKRFIEEPASPQLTLLPESCAAEGASDEGKHDLPRIAAYVIKQLQQTPALKRESIYHDAMTRFRCSKSTVYRALSENQRSTSTNLMSVKCVVHPQGK